MSFASTRSLVRTHSGDLGYDVGTSLDGEVSTSEAFVLVIKGGAGSMQDKDYRCYKDCGDCTCAYSHNRDLSCQDCIRCRYRGTVASKLRVVILCGTTAIGGSGYPSIVGGIKARMTVYCCRGNRCC